MNTLAAFFDWLDEVPRTPHGVLIHGGGGEMRVRPVEVAFAEWRSRHLGGTSQPACPPRFPELERRRHQLAILTHMLEKDDRG
jgi:hypothetical protein